MFCFDAETTDAVDSLVCFIDPAQSTGSESLREQYMAGGRSRVPKTSKADGISQESTKKIKPNDSYHSTKFIFLLLSHCFKVFRMYFLLAPDSKSYNDLSKTQGQI